MTQITIPEGVDFESWMQTVIDERLALHGLIEYLPEEPPAPPVECVPDHPNGWDIVFVSGQSNANTGLSGAVRRTLQGQGKRNWVRDYRANSHPIESWITIDGNFGPVWTPMITTMNWAVQGALTQGDPINGLTFVWFQGESNISVDPANTEYYRACLDNLMAEIESYSDQYWGGLPVTFALALPHYIGEEAAMATVRNAIQSAADEYENVVTFETNDIGRIDSVHLPNFPGAGSPEQMIAASRALEAARLAQNRCPEN